MNEPVCYKSLHNPFCIDLFLTNGPRTLQCTTTIETGISDFHKLAVTILKTSQKRKSQKSDTAGIIKAFEKQNYAWN